MANNESKLVSASIEHRRASDARTEKLRKLLIELGFNDEDFLAVAKELEDKIEKSAERVRALEKVERERESEERGLGTLLRMEKIRVEAAPELDDEEAFYRASYAYGGVAGLAGCAVAWNILKLLERKS